MRIWSIHPKYLDAKGLIALWRETLLAKNVLEGKTKGYTNHPQLIRFKQQISPLEAINQYLTTVLTEANSRNYQFDSNKIDKNFKPIKIQVTTGQAQFEWEHLKKKLAIRDSVKFATLQESNIELNEMFELIEGEIEIWEKI